MYPDPFYPFQYPRLFDIRVVIVCTYSRERMNVERLPEDYIQENCAGARLSSSTGLVVLNFQRAIRLGRRRATELVRNVSEYYDRQNVCGRMRR